MSTDSDTNDSIGRRIREERVRLGFTQAAFAKQLGVHRKSQGNYESGVREPDAAYLKAASLAGVDAGYLLTGERRDYWHSSLIHIVDLILDELDLTRRDVEFSELWKRGYDEYLLFVRKGEVPLRSEADQALYAFIRQSPRLMDANLLVDVIERLEFVVDTKGLQPSPQARASAIIRLYQEAKLQGAPLDLQTIAAAIKS